MYQRIKKVKFLRKFLPEDFIKDPEGVIETWSKSQLQGMRRFIHTIMKWDGSATLTTPELALDWGCSPASACRWKRDWIELKLITVTPCFREMENGRRLQTANIYELSPYFYTEEGRSKLSQYFPSLKYLALSLLTVMGALFTNGSIANEYYERGRIKERVIRTLVLNKKITGECGAFAMTREARSKRMGLESFIPSWVKEIWILQLTDAGKIRLACYEPAAIKYAQENLAKTTKFIENPFAYFITLCEAATANFGLSKNIDFLNSLKKAFRVCSTDEMLLSKVINKPQPVTVTEISPELLKREVSQSSSTQTVAVDSERPCTPLSVLKKYAPNSYVNEQKKAVTTQVGKERSRRSIGKAAPEIDIKTFQRNTTVDLSLEEAEQKMAKNIDSGLKEVLMKFYDKMQQVSQFKYENEST